MGTAILDRLLVHCMLLLIVSPLLIPSACAAARHTNTTVDCLPSDRSSLLDLIRGVSFNTDYPFDVRGPLVSWKPGSDCCDWEGVTCDPKSGHVSGLDLSHRGINGTLSASLFNLTSLRTLDLSDNFFQGDFPQVWFENLTQLTRLDLSSAGFNGGQIPVGISRLTDLISLNLSYCNTELRHPSFRTLVGNLSNLRELYLDGVDMSSNIDWGNALSTSMPHLRVLGLSSCNLPGLLPTDILTSHPNLTLLDLSWNSMLSGNLPDFPSINSLQSLSFYGTNLSGKIPDSISNLKHLTTLDFSEFGLTGMIPSSIGNLTQLVHLDLSGNNFTGPIPTSIGNLTHLTSLDLSNNSLSGSVPVSLFTHPALEELHLFNNQFSGELKEFSNPSMSLRDLDLSYNQLQGQIPISLFKLSALESLDLSSNDFSGMVELGKIRYQHELKLLDLSNNKIGGGIPEWIWGLGEGLYLNLSMNEFTHFEGPHILSWKHANIDQAPALDLHSNSLRGPIFLPSTSFQFIDYSNNSISSVIPTNISSYLLNCTHLLLMNNNLTGEIPASICEAHDLQVLDLSNNSLSGSIPSCLFDIKSLTDLNLKGNKLQGAIPGHFSKGCMLESLILSDNRLKGSISQTLLNCVSLKVLDLGNNQIVGGFPSWLGQMVDITILVLQGNALHGQVKVTESPEANNTFLKLQIFDLSSNHFNGNLPSNCFNNLKSMMSFSTMNRSDNITDKDYYHYEVSVTTNEYEYTFLRILAISYTFVDFSNNNFDGNIPKVIGNLGGLFMLNLSQNSLTGEIPSVIGNMRQLERLDLSANHLSGQIPQELTSLTFLTSLNLSSNNITGRIPQSKQFNTFSNASYLDNDGLCGSPLSKQCNNGSPNQTSAVQPIASDHSSPSTYIIVLALLVGLGFGVGFAVSVVLRNVQLKFWKRKNTTNI
ncbi:receptor-like protein 12 [Asparagus officinalis]|uniref:receptor-like protein 12 n=1 Tax=Asparagus officinalis TaxID=4686 RepID=UPI00098DF785|nr:receptor-like protein 12 [Asparagus officinalis]